MKLDEFTTLIPDKESGYVFQSNKVYLVHDISFDHDEYLFYSSTRFKTWFPMKWSLADVISDSGNISTHVYIEWNSRIKLLNPSRLDYVKSHPEIRTVKVASHNKNIFGFHHQISKKVTTNIEFEGEEKSFKNFKSTHGDEQECSSSIDSEEINIDQIERRSISESKYSVRTRASVLSSRTYFKPVLIKPNPPELTLPKPLSNILTPHIPDSDTIHWYVCNDVPKIRETISYFNNYIDGTFNPEIGSYFRMATMAENHARREGASFKNIFIEILEIDDVPKDFMSTLSKFKSGRILGGKRGEVVEYGHVNIFIITPHLPECDYLGKYHLKIVMHIEDLAVTPLISSPYIESRLRDNKLRMYIDLDKLYKHHKS